jgi:iron complex outermembrane recepter protein
MKNILGVSCDVVHSVGREYMRVGSKKRVADAFGRVVRARDTLLGVGLLFDVRLLGAVALVSGAVLSPASVSAAEIATSDVVPMDASPVDAAPGVDAAGVADSIPEVIVTAERRATSLEKTPVSVGVIGGAQVNDEQYNQLSDLSSSVASLQVPAASTPSLAYLFIRGIGTVSPTYNGAVGIYVDDVYQARVINSGIFGLPDVEQIEVLRGPQGTLYGQNTSAGAIKIISKTPGDEVQAFVQAAAGDYGQVDSRAYVSGPLIPGVLAAGVAVSHIENHGFTYDADTNREVNATNTDQARVKLHLTPGIEGLSATLSLYVLRDRSDNAYESPLNVPDPNPRVTYENLNLQIHDDAFLTALSLDYAIDEHLKIRSITGYRGFKDHPDPWSLDGLATDTFEWQLNLEQQQLSEELQVLGDYGALTFTSGAIDYHEDFTSNRPNVTYGVRAGVVSWTRTNSQGVYSQGHYAFNDRLGLTLGIRYYNEHDDYANTGYFSNADWAQGASKYSLTGLVQNASGVTPKIGIDGQLTPHLFGYASVTRGEKSGGYNPVAGSAAIAAIPIEPEKVTTYESGLKFTGWSDRLQLNGALFYNDFRDYQSLLSNVVVGGEVVNGSVAINAQKATTYGGELEAIVRPIEGLEASLAATVLDAKFVTFNFDTATGPVSYNGNQLPYTSKVNLDGALKYTRSLNGYGYASLRGEAKYTTHGYTDIANSIAIPNQTYVNLDARYTTPDGHWSTFATVRNLLDRTYAIGGLPAAPSPPGVLATVYNPPRMWQIGASFKF